MGKSRQRAPPQRGGRRGRPRHDDADDGEDDPLPSSAFDPALPPLGDEAPDPEPEQRAADDDDGDDGDDASRGPPPLPLDAATTSKFQLYQRSVQSPKGDISYLLKFFLTYVGGRSPIHLREDFCGTALICSEWLKSGIQRVATGLDLDEEALIWGLNNNFQKLGGGSCSRVRLLWGNVLKPLSSAKLITSTSLNGLTESNSGTDGRIEHCWPSVDIVCAFNYSCCCLHKRSDLVSYFKHVRSSFSNKGGIFAMDLYGGISSESPLKLRRRFTGFTYIWEQEAFDVLTRMTKISLHFQLNNKTTLRHAFSYHWRMWTLPEVRECLEEAGFDSVHFWLRDMHALDNAKVNEEIWENVSKYEETTSFHQQSAWNAYVVGVARQTSS